MKNKIYHKLLVVLLFLVSCTAKNEINVTIDNARGLEVGNKVLCKGKEIGKVTDISFAGTALNIKLQLQKDFSIPKNSKVALVSRDILGTRAISIELSEETGYYTNNDTLVCYDKSTTRLDTTLRIIESAIKEVKDSIPKLLRDQQNNN